MLAWLTTAPANSSFQKIELLARILFGQSVDAIGALPPAHRYDFDVVFPLNRPKFGFYDPNRTPNTVFQPDLLAARAMLGVELHFR